MNRDNAQSLATALQEEVTKIDPNILVDKDFFVSADLKDVAPNPNVFWYPSTAVISLTTKNANATLVMYAILNNSQALPRRQERIWIAKPGLKKLSCPVCTYFKNKFGLDHQERSVLVDGRLIDILNSCHQPYSLYCEVGKKDYVGDKIDYTPLLVLPGGIRSDIMRSWQERNKYRA